MNEEIPATELNWQPTGKRWLETEHCEACSGRGRILTEKESECDNCAGKGYVDEPVGGAVLCPACEGYRKDWTDHEAKCAACDGTGEIRAIMQTFLAEVPCEECSGTGEQDSGEISTEGCVACGAKGFGDGRTYHSLRRWDLDRERGANTEPVNRPEAAPARFRTGTGEFFWIIKCPKCLGFGPGRCDTCEERREVIVTAPQCERCLGAGEINVSVPSPCECCDGSGKDRITRDFKV
jgi:DnaJ-class molecular chaperone